jgi:hypothetical protein
VLSAATLLALVNGFTREQVERLTVAQIQELLTERGLA